MVPDGSNGFSSAARVPEVPGSSNSPSGVPGADNRTEILSPANEQYKDRKSLAAVPVALRAFQVEPRLCSRGPEGVPNSSK